MAEPMTAATRRSAYKSDMVKIIALGTFGMVGLLGMWGVDALLALCERHRWWTATMFVAGFGLAWAFSFLWVLIKVALPVTWRRKRRAPSVCAKCDASFDAVGRCNCGDRIG